MNWTSEDFRNGLCSVEQVGTARPPEEQPAPPPVCADDLARPLTDILNGAAKQAILEMGPVEFLKQNPDVLSKIAVKAVTPEKAVVPPSQLPTFPWLTARRHLYMEGLEIAQDVLAKNKEKWSGNGHVDPTLPEPARSPDEPDPIPTPPREK